MSVEYQVKSDIRVLETIANSFDNDKVIVNNNYANIFYFDQIAVRLEKYDLYDAFSVGTIPKYIDEGECASQNTPEMLEYFTNFIKENSSLPEFKFLKRGDVFFIGLQHRFDNRTAPYFWDGKKLIPCDSSRTKGDGDVPKDFKTITEFPIGFWKHIHWHYLSYQHVDLEKCKFINNQILNGEFKFINKHDTNYLVTEIDLSTIPSLKQKGKISIACIPGKNMKLDQIREKLSKALLDGSLEFADYPDCNATSENFDALYDFVRESDDFLKPRDVETLYALYDLQYLRDEKSDSDTNSDDDEVRSQNSQRSGKSDSGRVRMSDNQIFLEMQKRLSGNGEVSQEEYDKCFGEMKKKYKLKTDK